MRLTTNEGFWTKNSDHARTCPIPHIPDSERVRFRTALRFKYCDVDHKIFGNFFTLLGEGMSEWAMVRRNDLKHKLFKSLLHALTQLQRMERTDLLLVLLLVGWITGSTYYYVCHIREHCCGECDSLSDVSVFDLTARPSGPLQIVGEGLALEAEESIRFGRNQSLPVTTPPVDTVFQQVKQYLDAHTDHALHITGWYDDSEKNTTLFRNLGLARAETMKRQLVSEGVPSKQIGTAGRSSIDLTFSGDTLLNGLTFRVTDDWPVGKTAVDPDTLATLEERLRATSPTLYFDMGATTLPMSDSLERYLQDARNYLFLYPNRAIVLTGHTDNVGREEKNLVYGQERADFTQEALREFGINPNQIKTRSAGETQPIADNDTPEGRSKNRRVEIDIE